MTPPKCRVCGAAHWSNAPHVFAKQEQLELEGVRLHGFEDKRPVTEKAPTVTKKPAIVTPTVTKPPKTVTKPGGRPKKFRNAADKQQAYRKRKAHQKGTDPITGRPRKPVISPPRDK